MSGPPRVVADACVLVKSAVCDVFMDLAQSGIISLHWTPEIGSEFVKNWPKLRFAQAQRKRRESNSAELAGVEADAELAWLGDKARDRLFKFGLMVPQWIIPGWVDEPTAEAIYPRTLFNLGAPKYEGVDSKDYHVALAALTLKDAFEPVQDDQEPEHRETWLLTENLADLPPDVLSSLGA